MDTIAFATVKGRTQEPETLLMDIYHPEPDGRPHPAMILLHGGGFLVGNDRRQGYIIRLGEYLSAAGYVCFAPDYPLFPRSVKEEPGFTRAAFFLRGAREAAREVLLCREYIVSHAEEWGVDPARIGLLGGSAGGMAGHETVKRSDGFRCFVSLWGAESVTGDADQYPPTFLVHGTADQAVDPAFSVACYEKLVEAGVPAELMLLEGAAHTCIDRLEEFGAPMLSFLEKWLG